MNLGKFHGLVQTGRPSMIAVPAGEVVATTRSARTLRCGASGLLYQHGDNFVMAHLSRPGERLCPRFSVLFFRDGSVFREQSHKFDSAPAACPTKGCAFQNVVAIIRTRAGL
jgi:hypothetical protein